jgi:chemotaxis family two-component system response regulator Rcp1
MRIDIHQSRDILVIDDNPADVRLVEEALTEAKIEHRLSVVRNGEEALDYLRHRGPYTSATWPDLILLDLNLPRKDGRQLLAEVKGDPELQRIPVIVLTTSSAVHDVTLSYGVHANGYVVKPIQFSDLCDVMRSIADFWLRVATLPPRNGI